MALSSLQLEAFLAVTRERSFSAAAKGLAITQSALSQRVLNLEQDLGVTLLIRESTGLRLTESGEKLLYYCQSKELLENEFLAGLKSKTELSGLVRIAAFSTITQSVLIPLLGDFVKLHPAVQLEMINAELREIPALLTSGRADFVFTTSPIEKQGLETHLLGHEENVLIQPTNKKYRDDVFLDHDSEDATTFDFFKLQGKKSQTWKRSYLNDIYTLIEGVKAGMGRAVVPLHIVKHIKGIEVSAGSKVMLTPIYLNYYAQAFYTELQKKVLERFLSDLPKNFKKSNH